jgi:hypothetical protein
MTKDEQPAGTVYIIGAGASHAVCGFPLLGEFLQDTRDDVASHVELHRYLKMRFGDDGRDGLTANLEDVLADLDNTLFGLGEIWYGSASHPERLGAQIVRSQLLDVVEKRLAAGSAQGQSPEGVRHEYEGVIGNLTGADTVMTFNYDRSLDYASGLRPYGYVLNPSVNYLSRKEIAVTGPWLLHIHGSIDYLVCSNSECPHGWRILGPREPREEQQRICGICGADLEIAIVPPSMIKSFQRYPLLSVLARIAKECLVTAERIVLWWFSCPSSDHHVAWLLRSCRRGHPDTGSLRRIDVIDPNAEKVLERFKVLVSPGQATECRVYRDHEEYVAKLLEDDRSHG